MCGVGGWFGRIEGAEETAAELLDALEHRGPDGRGERHFEYASLLHTRLRIIDLSRTGDQPMANEDGSVWIVFNGEIYNHKTLQHELESKGHRFRGHCDAEVLPHLYEEHGDEMLSRLRGMFAFALLDCRRRRLLLARDRFGIKPLYYTEGRDFLGFASELAALRRLPGVDLAPDPQAIADFTALLFVPPPLTIHRGIRALAPGEFLTASLERDGDVQFAVRRFQTFAVVPDHALTLERAVHRAEGLIEQAVARQLESEVPFGALLSGGIDSSLVSLFAQRQIDGDLLTYNVRLPDPKYDETWAARLVANQIGSRHLTLEMDADAGGWDDVTGLLRHAGQPFADTSLFAVDAVSRAMRRHVTVAIAGDGGDEGFGGYNLYWRLARANKLRALPASVWHFASALSPLLSGVRLPRSRRPMLQALAAGDDTSLVQALYCWLSPSEQADLLLDSGSIDPVRRHFELQWDPSRLRSQPARERLSAHAVEVNIRLWLAGDFLVKVDTASMRHSLEVRVPMLDEDLIEFGLTLPHNLRVEGRSGKRVLRELASRHLPRRTIERPKQGFAVPVDRWVTEDFRNAVRETLLDRAAALTEVFDHHVYMPWVESFVTGQPHRGLGRGELYQRVIMLLALELALSTPSVASAR